MSKWIRLTDEKGNVFTPVSSFIENKRYNSSASSYVNYYHKLGSFKIPGAWNDNNCLLFIHSMEYADPSAYLVYMNVRSNGDASSGLSYLAYNCIPIRKGGAFTHEDIYLLQITPRHFELWLKNRSAWVTPQLTIISNAGSSTNCYFSLKSTGGWSASLPEHINEWRPTLTS